MASLCSFPTSQSNVQIKNKSPSWAITLYSNPLPSAPGKGGHYQLHHILHMRPDSKTLRGESLVTHSQFQVDIVLIHCFILCSMMSLALKQIVENLDTMDADLGGGPQFENSPGSEN